MSVSPSHQPRQLPIRRLAPGQTPPQFVVISWDGAGETGSHLLSRFRSVALDIGATMTLFLSGIYMVPRQHRSLYSGPHHTPGASAIPFFSDSQVHATIEGIGQAWLEGHEIGTHFNGHFCGKGGVREWSVADWLDEIGQAQRFVATWRTTTGFTDLPPLPFDYGTELIGGRTPCLEGSTNLQRAAARLGWRYDTSATGIQTWPHKVQGLWNLPLQSIPFPGHHFQVLSMDYNFMANQSVVGKRVSTNGSPALRPTWRAQAKGAYLAGFDRAHGGNRAPLVIGNHFEQWNGGIYMDAVEDAMRVMASAPDTHLVSFRQLVDWLDAQDPAVLARLRTLGIGQAPTGGWADFLA
jgi:hypothetical protein